MEKNYTLMKTLTAFLNLLFPHRKNSRAVNNEHVSATVGCSTGTTVNNQFIYVNDPDLSGSFLFFEQAVINGQRSTVDSPQSMEDDKKIKSKEELKKVNDELAQRNMPKPVYKTWKERVNDDLAACTAVDDPLYPPLKNSYKRKNDSINVDHIFTINDTITLNSETRTNKNDAFLPFASFSFFVRRSLGVGGFLKSFFQKILTGAMSAQQHKPGLMQNSLKPQYRPIPIISNHSNMKKFLRRSSMIAITIVIANLFLHQAVNAQVTQPTAWTKVYDQAAATGTGQSFAVAGGSNRILVVAIATNSGGNSGTVQDPTTITYGGVGLTKATGNGGGTSARMHTWLYFLKNNAVMDGTSKALNVTMGAQSQTNVNFTVWYSVYAGVDQTPATYTTGDNSNNTTGSGPAALSAAMAVNANAQAVYISNILNVTTNVTPGYTINANWTSGGNNTGTSGALAWKVEVAKRTIPGANTTDAATTSAITPTGTIRYAMSAISLPAAVVPILAITGATNHGSSCGTPRPPITYTITNTGLAPASGVTVTSNNAQFVVSNLSSTTIAANGGTATYQVTFTPGSSGPQSATVTVASTTVGSNSPTSSLTGTGNAVPIAHVDAQSNINCFAANDGTITVSASGGSSPYTFSVDNGTNYLPATGTNLRLFTGLAPNTPYRIRVKDNNGCESRSVQ
jgi:hypothetical protein